MDFQPLQTLPLQRCPWYNVDTPDLPIVNHFKTANRDGENHRWWCLYACRRCGGVVVFHNKEPGDFESWAVFPGQFDLEETIPKRAREYLNQAMASLHAPAGAVILTASAVDAMLKAKGLKTGSLYARIDKAAEDHLITAEMAAWAHEVRLGANDQRHADEEAPLPNLTDAERGIEFAKALAQFLFVLPARVQRGRRGAGAVTTNPVKAGQTQP
jgi:hypothetical protein